MNNEFEKLRDTIEKQNEAIKQLKNQLENEKNGK